MVGSKEFFAVESVVLSTRWYQGRIIFGARGRGGGRRETRELPKEGVPDLGSL